MRCLKNFAAVVILFPLLLVSIPYLIVLLAYFNRNPIWCILRRRHVSDGVQFQTWRGDTPVLLGFCRCCKAQFVLKEFPQA